jgi:hypothetical protein
MKDVIGIQYLMGSRGVGLAKPVETSMRIVDFAPPI